MASDKTAARRRYTAEFQAQVRAECDAPGASVAKVAMAHGINANVVHRWRQLARQERAAAAVSVATTAAVASPNEFVPVVLKPTLLAPRAAQQAAAVSPDIRIQVRRGTTAVTITWPVVAASQCAAWVRELLA
jgi:transposase